MPVAIVKAQRFLDDEPQFEWYLDKAGEDVADRYLAALDELGCRGRLVDSHAAFLAGIAAIWSLLE